MFFQKLPCMLPNLHIDIWIMDMVKAKGKKKWKWKWAIKKKQSEHFNWLIACLVLHRAKYKFPAYTSINIAQEGINPLTLARIRNTGHNSQFSRYNLHH